MLADVARSDQSHEPEIPPFQLPEWGTDGAPPLPPSDESAVSEEAGHISTTAPPGGTRPILATTELPPRWRSASLVGVITAEGTASTDTDLTATAASATAAALEALEREARAQAADAVVGVRLSVLSRKRQIVVVAYGTAVRLNS